VDVLLKQIFRLRRYILLYRKEEIQSGHIVTRLSPRHHAHLLIHARPLAARRSRDPCRLHQLWRPHRHVLVLLLVGPRATGAALSVVEKVPDSPATGAVCFLLRTQPNYCPWPGRLWLSQNGESVLYGSPARALFHHVHAVLPQNILVLTEKVSQERRSSQWPTCCKWTGCQKGRLMAPKNGIV